MKKLLTIFIFLIISTGVYSQQYSFQTVVNNLREPTFFDILPNGDFIIDQKPDSAFTPTAV